MINIELKFHVETRWGQSNDSLGTISENLSSRTDIEIKILPASISSR